MQEVNAATTGNGQRSALSQRLLRELRAAVLSFCNEEADPLCARVKENLFEASERSTRVDEQNVLLTAYTALIKGSPNFIRMLRQYLPMTVEKALESDKTAVPVDMTTTQRLKLVEVDDVEREVLILNMVRKLEDFCGDTLSPLTLRICHLKGIEHVHLQLNPFKPETFVRGFTDAWEAFDGNKLSTRVMLRSLVISNFLPLNALYAELNDLLISNDIMREERYSIRRSAESPAGALWKRSAPSPGAGGDGGLSMGGGAGGFSSGGQCHRRGLHRTLRTDDERFGPGTWWGAYRPRARRTRLELQSKPVFASGHTAARNCGRHPGPSRRRRGNRGRGA